MATTWRSGTDQDRSGVASLRGTGCPPGSISDVLPPRHDTRPVALLVPGAGSTPDFLERAFAGPLGRQGFRLASMDLRGVRPGEELGALDDAVGAWAPTVLGGVSFGAHLAARWTASRALAGAGRPRTSVRTVLAVMPAWTGAPGRLAGLTAVSATRIAAHGSAALLAELDREVPATSDTRWIVEELCRAWPTWGDAALAEHLHQVAQAPGPTLAELGSLSVPLAVVALGGDLLHPAEIASGWAVAAGRTALVHVAAAVAGRDSDALGVAAVRALQALAP